MSLPKRITAFVILPIFMVGLGWQMGMRFERWVGESIQREWEQKMSEDGATMADPERAVDLGLFWQVWRLLLTHYIDPADLQQREMLFGAIRGMVEGVGDPYTAFMSPEENAEFRDSLNGELEGIGAQLEFKEGQIVVVAPIRGSPAASAGLLPKDIIIRVDGETTEGKSLDEIIHKIRGPKGTTVTVDIARKGSVKDLSFTITREEIHVPSVEQKTVKSGGKTVGVVSLNQFGADSVTEMRKALVKVKEDSPDALILDLRFNGGGYLDGAVDIVSFFIAAGKVVTVAEQSGAPQHHYVSGKPLLPDTPMVVLINGGSASAAEIVAGALQDLGRATIIGEQSFGKGTVQEVIDLPMKTSLRVTTARWLTPSGRDLGKHGVDPTIVVERTPEDFAADRDPQMDKAVEYLTTGHTVTVSMGTNSRAQK
jgi:carboxyl-terminal processing protease